MTLSLGAAFAFTAAGFLAIYFGIGTATVVLSRWVFPTLGLGRALGKAPGSPQLRHEIAASLVSVAIFGGYGALTVWLERLGWVEVDWQPRPLALVWQLPLLVLWNEVHFYACHRLLHTPLLYRKVHRVHHRSIPPTPFATFSFHWAESALLGSVMLLLMPFVRLNVLALAAFPVVSLALNNLGHMDYDLVPGRSTWHPLAASRRHSLHHHRVRGNYGFLLPVLDWVFGTRLEEG